MEEKYFKRHLQQNNLLGKQIDFLKISTKIILKNDTYGPFSTKPQLSLAVQRYIVEDCLNIQKIPSSSSSQVKMTDPLARYTFQF